MEVLGLLARVGCVFGLLGLVLHLLRRSEVLRGTRRTGVLQVLGSTRLGKGAALTVVRIGDNEYVLGVTDHAVTLLDSAPSEAPAAVPAVAAVPDFAAALGARLRARRGPRATPLSDDAVTAALASVRGDDDPSLPAPPPATPLRALLPLPRTPGDAAGPARPALVADGSSTPPSRHALRRAVTRTDALRDEEHPWTRSSRPSTLPGEPVGRLA